jgi:AraC-like DNA-binding protein
MRLGAGARQGTELVCGFLGCDARPFNPLLETLPPVIHLRGAEQSGALVQLVQLARNESANSGPGSECMLARLSELLFIEVVRRHIATLPEGQTGWLAGLRDELVGRCLGRLHERPAHAWTLEDLAREVGTSRSVLAERFAHYAGMPPMQYLARWRMQLACGLLVSGQQNLAQIAAEVGYGSEAALSRAFKREVGVAPAEFRRIRSNATTANASATTPS